MLQLDHGYSRLWVLCLLFFILACGRDKEAQRHYDDGMSFFGKKNFVAAIKEFRFTAYHFAETEVASQARKMALDSEQELFFAEQFATADQLLELKEFNQAINIYNALQERFAESNYKYMLKTKISKAWDMKIEMYRDEAEYYIRMRNFLKARSLLQRALALKPDPRVANNLKMRLEFCNRNLAELR